eukprot:9626367-Alexandrium_andersonii.AAC.1
MAQCILMLAEVLWHSTRHACKQHPFRPSTMHGMECLQDPRGGFQDERPDEGEAGSTTEAGMR